MVEILVAGIIIYIVYYISNKILRKTSINSNHKNKQSIDKPISDKLELAHFKKNNSIILKPKSSLEDDSIIDVTDQSYTINTSINLKKYVGLPFWEHQYIYFHYQINNASDEQKKFYNFFKTSFLNGEYYDLEGNWNYAFILLFDLANEFNSISKLESQFKILGECYQITKSYSESLLIKIMDENGDSEGASRLRSEHSYNYEYWRLGIKYKAKLKLNEEDVTLLNKLSYPNNNFCSVEYCFIEILKLYISVISQLKINYIDEGTTIDARFSEVADLIARKTLKYRIGSQNYRYFVESATNDFYNYIFKHCENAVREYYGHKRKINIETYDSPDEVKIEFDTKITSKVSSLISTLISGVSLPDEETDIELNSKNTNRWKIKFEELKANFNSKPKDFIDSIIFLGKLNKKNPSIENIFFEASKFISKYDNESALILYIYYLYYDLNSTNFDNKQLTKTIQKSLFKTNEQFLDFEAIVYQLIKDKDLEIALTKVSKIYEVRRKKILLDKTSIKQVQQQHSGTVELLNEYLKDDFEDDSNSINSQEINNEEIKFEIIQKYEEPQKSLFINGLSFSPLHLTTLEFFVKHNFSILQSEFEVFAKSKGVFKNQLIESINEICFECLDDLLIEEDEEYYTISTNYFQKITIK